MLWGDSAHDNANGPCHAQRKGSLCLALPPFPLRLLTPEPRASEALLQDTQTAAAADSKSCMLHSAVRAALSPTVFRLHLWAGGARARRGRPDGWPVEGEGSCILFFENLERLKKTSGYFKKDTFENMTVCAAKKFRIKVAIWAAHHILPEVKLDSADRPARSI